MVSLMNIIFKGLIGRHVSKTKIIVCYKYIFNAILEERICFLGFWNVGLSMVF
jgi:hypothetical protein